VMRGSVLSGALVLALLGLWPPAWAAGQDRGEDPNLEQRIDAGQRVVTSRKVLSAGHVDVGPRFVDGEWTLMIHDDAAKAGGKESVWRHTDRTVLQVTDDAVLPVPDDPAYAFLPSEPGADVYVVPQTQDPDVVWVGWNTQDPEVMDTINRGVTMTLTDIQGPGELVVYLQSGDFAEPKVLWDSTGEPKPVWVDVNTHTHANWVFSAAGVYLVRVKISADLIDGSTVTDTRELRFAVGSGTSTDEAFAASWRGVPADGEGAPSAATPAATDDSSGPAATVAAAIGVGAIGLAAGLVLVVMRGNRAKQRARSTAARREGGT
jgi:surface-anchored protein